MSFPTIETERLHLRPHTAADLEPVLAMDADPLVMRYIPPGPRDPDVERENARTALLADRPPETCPGFWAITEQDDPTYLGWVIVKKLDEEQFEVGYRLVRAAWGRGFATEAARAAVRFGFESAGLERIVGITLPENLPSRRVLEKVGLRYERMEHHYGCDVALHAITREQHRALGE